MEITGKHFDVKIRLLEDILGTVPKNKEIYGTYIESLKPQSEDQDKETDTVPEDPDKKERAGWTGFHTDEEGLFIYDYMVKGFIKNAANVLKDDPSIKLKNLRSKLTNFVFVFPRRIHLGKKEPDGVFERPLKGVTAQGVIVTLVRSDVVKAGTEISFRLFLMHHKEVTKEILRLLFEYGKLQGLGQFRNGSFGRFEVVSFEEVKA